jgi:queuine tRNA-ribosyltransferase
MFGIVQGASYDDMRLASLDMITDIDFDGFAIGGLSVGEKKETMYRISDLIAPKLPINKPRYIMGVGEPVDLVNLVETGVDMFDCVMATRNARNGSLFTFNGKISIKKSIYKDDPRPIDDTCHCKVCRNYSRAYLRHLFNANEILASVLNSHHNLYFFKKLMEKMRQAIIEGRFQSFKKDFLTQYLQK